MIHPARWLIKNRVIYAYAEGTVSLTEMREHSNRMMALLDTGTAPVHVILESSPEFRPEVLDLRSGLDNLRFVHHTNIGWAVQVLQGNHTMRFVARLIARFARLNYQIVESRQDALEFLQVMDTALDFTAMDESVFVENV